MKIKQFLTITDTLAFSKGDFSSCFSLYSTETNGVAGWSTCGEVEFDVDIDTKRISAEAIADIDDEAKRIQLAFTEKMAFLEQSKQELLCIGSDSE